MTITHSVQQEFLDDETKSLICIPCHSGSSSVHSSPLAASAPPSQVPAVVHQPLLTTPTPLLQLPSTSSSPIRTAESTKGERWSEDEHERFLLGMELFKAGPWKKIAGVVGTRDARQTMSHAQKYRQKIKRRKLGLPTPEPPRREADRSQTSTTKRMRTASTIATEADVKDRVEGNTGSQQVSTRAQSSREALDGSEQDLERATGVILAETLLAINTVGSNTRTLDGVMVGTSARAMYFARGEAPPASESAAARKRRTGGAEENKESWPGYFETARELGEQRQAAQAARLEELQRLAAGENADGEAEKPKWVPRKKPRKSIRTQDRMVPRLQELAIECIAQHIEVMPTLEYVDASSRHRVAKAVVKLRRMKADVLPLFVFPGVNEIDIPDCSNIDESSFVSSLQQCTAEGLALTILRLGLCGRCVSDGVIVELGDSLRSVEQLAVNGCYRLSDAGIEALVRRCTPSLQEFELSCNQRITASSIRYFGELQHLHALSLSECPQLNDSALQALLSMQNLRKLELNQMERISDEFVGELTAKLPDLEDLSLARCSQLTDVAVRSALENCRNLRALDVSDLHELTDDSFEPIQRLGHALRRVSIRRCLGLTDVSIEFLAIGANSFLERLEMSSVAETTDASLLALQKHCAENITELDISFCRNISEDCLGIFTDEAANLQKLVLWGCTQITARFLTCHSREDLLINGHPLLTGLTIKY